MTYVDCLDECERGDVVVIRPATRQRARGVGPVWFERVAGDELTGVLQRWLTQGGPGDRAVPVALATFTIARTGEPDETSGTTPAAVRGADDDRESERGVPRGGPPSGS